MPKLAEPIFTSSIKKSAKILVALEIPIFEIVAFISNNWPSSNKSFTKLISETIKSEPADVGKVK